MNRGWLTLASFLVALAATAGVYHLDQSRLGAQNEQHSLQWARQMAIQAEGLAVFARARDLEDPSGWAISFLNQSIEPRLMKISKYRRSNPGKDSEKFRLDRVSGILEYDKIATPENGEGFRVQIFPSEKGFWGTTSKMGNDLSVFSVFIFFWSWSFFGFFWMAFRKSHGTAPAPVSFEEAQRNLSNLGIALRNLVRDAHALATGTVQASEGVLPLQKQLHTVLTQLHGLRRSPSVRDNPELIQTLRSIEVGLEPLVTDVDLATGFFKDVTVVTRRLNVDITIFKTDMLKHVRLLQRLKDEQEKSAA